VRLPVQAPGYHKRGAECSHLRTGIEQSDNPSGVPTDWKLCCGDDQYRKYVGPDNTNRCYEKQSDGTWNYTYGSRCDAHDHDCFAQVCTY